MIATKNTLASDSRYDYNYYNYSGVIFGSDTYAKKIAEKQSASSSASSVSGSANQMYGTNNASGLSTDTQNYLSNIKNYASNLKASLTNLLAKGTNSVLNKYTQKSGNEDLLTVTSTSTQKTNSFDVRINNIAKAQKNEGTAMQAKGLSFQTNQTYEINIQSEANNKTENFSIAVKAGDTNESIQKRLADDINKRNMGITASVITDSKTNESKLILESAKTGQSNGFFVTGAMADTMGLNNTTTNAEDAVYSINNSEWKTSASNTVSIDNKTSVTLKKASNEMVTVSSEKDVSSAVSEMKKMVEAYNSLLNTARDNGKDKGALKLYEQLGSLALSYGNSLAKIGVNFNENGTMAIDEKKLTEAAKNGTLENFLNPDSNGTANYGFAYRMDKIATEASNNPLTYYKGNTETKTSSSAGTSPTNSASASNDNYLSSLSNYESIYMKNFAFFNKYYNIGLMFDSMF